MKFSLLSTTFLYWLSAHVAHSDAAVVEIPDWAPLGQPFPNMTAKVGDILTFTWAEGANHNVFVNPSGTCDEEESVFLGDTSPQTYKVPPELSGESITFACQTPGHCQGGQIVTFSIEVDPEEPEEPAGDAAAPHGHGTAMMSLCAIMMVSFFL